MINIISKIKIKIASLCSEYIDTSGSMLVEIAISISIICIISGLFFSKMNLMNKFIKHQNASKNIEISVEALIAYLSNNNYLPCPCLDNSGFETSGCASNLENCIGNIPYNTLGIPEKFSKDEHGKTLTYIVEPSLTYKDDTTYPESNQQLQDSFCSPIDGRIYIEDIENFKENPIVFAIAPSRSLPKIENNKILIQKNYDTFWIQRDLILIKYFKTTPCLKIKNSPTKTGDEIFNLRLFDSPNEFSL